MPPRGIPGDLRPILQPATAPRAKNRVLTATMDGAFHSICTYNAAEAPRLETRDRNRARLARGSKRCLQSVCKPGPRNKERRLFREFADVPRETRIPTPA